ncbi:Heme:hemopexin utilization protein A [Bordetella ansorpii]|uniref:Heme:hemopexin utilization protein A n=1 Tax=Bordetella ansorpii TaxID=288768 RepID=A0A157S4I2_9BORD|nr:MBG domain-containing protein [Bordetella ansorpii]SAI65314.1 Heme:hemopexin utilization protein A [Bordetella ansorpii]
MAIQAHKTAIRRTSINRLASARPGHRPFTLTLGAVLVASAFLPQTATAAGPALPTGGQFAGGNGTISQSGNTLTVNQASNRAIINWNGFSVGEAAAARFNNGNGATLNRVTGNTASRIDGNLSASGSVYLVNPSGVVVGPKGTVNTGGTFAASTHDVGNQQFMQGGDLTFKGGSQAQVINAGTIRSAQGDVALIARRVENSGTIEAPNGTVALAAGYEVLMRDAADADGKLSVKIGGGDTEALNSGAIRAAQAELRANGGNVYALAGNTQGVIKATGTASKGGRIFLTAGDTGTVQSTGTLEARHASQGGTVTVTGGNVEVAGTIDASATAAGGQGGQVVAIAGNAAKFSGTIKAEGGQGGKGGFVETSGKKHIEIKDSTRVSTQAQGGQTGRWLVDPDDLVVDDIANGGNVSADTIMASLAQTNFELVTGNGSSGNGDITVRQAISWDSGNTLSLLAARNIAINAAITGRNGGLTLTPAAAGQITTSAAGAIDVGTFSLTQGIWNQIGGTLPAFSARDFRVADGASFVRLLGGDGASGTPWLIGDVYGLQGLRRLSVPGGPNGSQAFALANDIDASGTRLWNGGKGFLTIQGFGGVFDGTGHVVDGLTINRPDETYQGLFEQGGLGAVFRNVGLTNVSITGNHVGGALAARLSGGSVTNVYVTGSVAGQDTTGGLVGLADQVTFQNVTSSAAVSGQVEVGGLVGRMRAGLMSGAYATGNVSGSQGVGGLIGYSGLGYGNPIQGGTLSNVYASGAVSGILDVGGLIGYAGQNTSASNAYWDVDSTGYTVAAGSGFSVSATGLGSTSAYAQSSYAGFDFGTTWFMIDGSTRPMLRSEYSTTLRTAHQVQLMAMDLGGAYTLGNDIDMSATRLLSDVWRTDLGFVSIAGVLGQRFTGSLDGGGHVIDGLYIRSVGNVGAGLIGQGDSATVRALSLANVSIDGGGATNVGAVMGLQNGGLVEDVDVTGSVTGGINTGGAVGYLDLGGNVTNSRSAATVANTAGTSGVAGGLVGTLNDGTIQGSFASGDVSSTNYAGGLAGHVFGTVVASGATGAVSGETAGGLAGDVTGTVLRSYATGSVTATEVGGGLAGILAAGGLIGDAYAMGAVSGGAIAGGLVGLSAGNIVNTYATGYLSGAGVKGGLVASASQGTGSILSSYWNFQTTGLNSTSGGGTAMTTAQLQGTLPPGFDPQTWSTGAGLYPYLQWQFASGETPKAVSGTVTTAGGAAAGAGGSVIVASQGAQAGQGSIGANGYFYALTAPDAVDDNVLAYLHGMPQKGATFNDQGITSGLALRTGELGITTSASSVSATMAALSGAMGDLASGTDLDFIGPLGGSVLSTSQGVGLDLQAGASAYLLNGDITASGALSVATSGLFGVSGDITLTGAQGLVLSGNASWADASSLSLVAPQGLTLAGSIDAEDGAFSIDAGQDITLTGNTAIDVDTYRQTGAGAWRQVGSTLPAFYARDFQLDVASGARFLRAQGGTGAEATPYRIFDVYGLQGIVAGGGYYALAGDIDASGTAYWNSGAGFVPIQAFDGSLDGQGHAIDGLSVTVTGLSQAGLFASLSSAQIRDLTLSNVQITGSTTTGALAGLMAGGTVDNVSVTGTVTGNGGTVGGLVGMAREDASISNSHASADVSGGLIVGGLVGHVNGAIIDNAYATGDVSVVVGPALGAGGLVGYLEGGSVSNVHATGTVSTSAGVDGTLGGLVGYAVQSAIADAYATGDVTAQGDMFGYGGGLVGTLIESTIDRSFATGQVSSSASGGALAGGLAALMQGPSAVRGSYASGAVSVLSAAATDAVAGGLVGAMMGGTISDAYATGAVSNAAVASGAYAGGLAGLLAGGSISNSYATGAVSGAAPQQGGLAGGIDAADPATPPTVSASFWLDNGSQDNGLGTRLTLAQFQDLSTYADAGWDIDDAGGTGKAWRIYGGHTGPLLRSFLKSVTVTAADASKTYDGNAYQGAFAYTTSDALAVLQGSLGEDLTGVNAGTYTIANGLYSGQTGYDIVMVDGTLTISKRGITVTADDASRVYGDADPAFTYTVGGAGLVGSDTLTGALASTANAASDVGNYGITIGTLAASDNYDITSFTGGTLTVGKRAISIVANDLSRDYGDANPALTYTVGGLGLVNGDALSGALATAAGAASNVGAYGILQGTLAASGNYDVTGFTGGTLTIGKRAISITANDLSRDYGDANPALTYTVGGRGLANGDVLSGALATAAGVTSNVGAYGILQGTLAASGNYDVTGFTGGTLTIGKRAISITANDLSRDYGDANPALTYTVGGRGLANGDVLSGALTTAAGVTSNVGAYGILQGTLAASGNYDVTGFTGGTLTVGKRAISIVANDQSRDYGDANPALTYTVGGRGLVNGDALSGALSTTAGVTSNVGVHGILQGTLAASGNYDITSYTAGALSIAPRALVIDADGQTRVYGDVNPALTYTVGGKGLVNGDALSGQLATAAQQTSDVASYGITQGTLAASPNYMVTYNGADLVITPRTISVTVTADGKVYDATRAATGSVGLAGVLFGDAVTADGRFLFADVNAGTGKRVDVSDIVLAGGKAGNYVLASNTAATSADITPRVLVVTANGLSRQYGDDNPLLTYLLGGQGLVGGDTLGGALATTATARSDVGSYGIAQGTLAASSNYEVRYVGANLLVTPRSLTVTADDQSRMTGQVDPALTWTVSGGSLAAWDSLAQVVSGQLAREPGDALGRYVIGQGSLAASANYALGFVPGTFTIVPGGLSQVPAGLYRTPFEDGGQPRIAGQEPGPRERDDGCGNGVAGGGVHPCNRALGSWLRVSSR